MWRGLLLVSVTRWWWDGRWQHGTGRNWQEILHSGFSVTGPRAFSMFDRIVAAPICTLWA